MPTPTISGLLSRTTERSELFFVRLDLMTDVSLLAQRWYLCSLPTLLFAAVICSGCVGGETLQPVEGPGIRVTYEGQPLAGLHVRLHATDSADVLAQGVSGVDGVVRFRKLPSPSPAAWRLSMESIGDGGWILSPVYADPSTSQLVVEAMDEQNPPTVKLPQGALQSL